MNRDVRDVFRDYKARGLAVLARYRLSWLAVALTAPAVALPLLLVGRANPSAIPSAGERTADSAWHTVPLPLPAPADAATDAATDAAPPRAAARAGTASPAPADDSLDAERLDLIVHRGDNLNRLFRRNHLHLADLAAMLKLTDAARYLKALKPGDDVHIMHDGGHVLALRRNLDEFNALAITEDEDGYSASKVSRDVEVRTVAAHGVIKTSLFDAGVQAGMTDAQTMQMAGIFQWDIDFINDVRSGDEFTVIYQQLWRKGKKLRNGDILAAEFVNRGRTYRAARYTDPAGRTDYYTPDGHSVRKAFLRAPVDFTRISSRFNMHRMHPILHRVRPHEGVDYAAPIGTPVKAAGDGEVIFRGRKGGYGNVVVLKHGGHITTLYGHLSRFGKYRVGRRVKQGDIIGYVGMTGLATGPHLHYEYRIDGVHRNPRTVPLPPADPVPAADRVDFQASTAPLWRRLDLYQRVRLTASGRDGD